LNFWTFILSNIFTKSRFVFKIKGRPVAKLASEKMRSTFGETLLDSSTLARYHHPQLPQKASGFILSMKKVVLIKGKLGDRCDKYLLLAFQR